MIDVSGKVAFVTGGASGIGLGIAKAFAEGGMKIVIADVDEAKAGEAVEDFRSVGTDAMSVALDVTSRSGWEEAAAKACERFGGVDVLVNNAGVAQSRLPDGEPLLMTDMSEQLFRMVIDVNVVGVFLGVRTIGAMMVARGGGSIVNTASMAGFLAPGGSSAYVTSKFAVVGLSESLRCELAPHNVGVSVFCPGGVKSNLVATSAARRERLVTDGGEKQARLLAARQASSVVMDAINAGRCVLLGVRNNDLYIFSHPEYRDLVDERFGGVLASFGESAQPGHIDPEHLLRMSRNPVYAEALARAGR